MQQKPRIAPERPSDNIETLISDGVSIMSGDFINNKRTGQWNYLGGKSADNVSRTSTKSTDNFIDGLLDGEFSYLYEDPQARQFIYSFSESV